MPLHGNKKAKLIAARRLILVALTLIPSFALADYVSAMVSDVVAIYDGDTFTANVDEWPPVVGERNKRRIAGCAHMFDSRLDQEQISCRAYATKLRPEREGPRD